jgi:hypothetical protein
MCESTQANILVKLTELSDRHAVHSISNSFTKLVSGLSEPLKVALKSVINGFTFQVFMGAIRTSSD